ncbi:MAG: hypothetical protein PHT07_21525 [Paludibacter sp.]|nr:hypothetical protein [Paludibacter sp.]
MKEELLKISNELYDAMPTGEISDIAILASIKAHFDKLNAFIDKLPDDKRQLKKGYIELTHHLGKKIIINIRGIMRWEESRFTPPGEVWTKIIYLDSGYTDVKESPGEVEDLILQACK